MSAQDTNKKKNRGGMWWKMGKNGSRYLSGNIEVNGEKVYFVAFEQKDKEAGSKKPDFSIPLPLENTASKAQNNAAPDRGEDISF